MMFGMGFGSIIWILALLLIGWGVFNMFNQNRRNNQSYMGDGGFPSEGASALDILKQRYARGEISKTEYERMKQDLLNS